MEQRPNLNWRSTEDVEDHAHRGATDQERTDSNSNNHYSCELYKQQEQQPPQF